MFFFCDISASGFQIWLREMQLRCCSAVRTPPVPSPVKWLSWTQEPQLWLQLQPCLTPRDPEGHSLRNWTLALTWRITRTCPICIVLHPIPWTAPTKHAHLSSLGTRCILSGEAGCKASLSRLIVNIHVFLSLSEKATIVYENTLFNLLRTLTSGLRFHFFLICFSSGPHIWIDTTVICRVCQTWSWSSPQAYSGQIPEVSDFYGGFRSHQTLSTILYANCSETWSCVLVSYGVIPLWHQVPHPEILLGRPGSWVVWFLSRPQERMMLLDQGPQVKNH